MKIHLMRHYKVDFTWKPFYDSNGFDIACKLYNSSPIVDNKILLDLAYMSIYASELRRGADTAKLLGISTHSIIKTELLNEVPLKSFISTSLKLPTFIWRLVGRIQWYINNKRQPETRTQTMHRINDFLNLIEYKSEDTLIIGHGFYFFAMKKVLQQRKFIGKSVWHYKNGQIATFLRLS